MVSIVEWTFRPLEANSQKTLTLTTNGTVPQTPFFLDSFNANAAMLLRRFLGARLSEYYAQPSHKVVGSTGDRIDFKSLWGGWHWRRVYGKLYQQQEGQWLTPVELFRPYYSNILANFILETTKTAADNDKIEIIELGGGRGSNCELILTHLKKSQPQFYDRVSYTIVDASPSLQDLQQQILGCGDHANKVKFLRRDLLDVSEQTCTFLDPSDISTVVLAMELIDNLPHDKVRRSRLTRKLEQVELEESPSSTASSTETEPMREVFVPLSDKLLSRTLEILPAYGGTGRSVWVPTVACTVFDLLRKLRPNSSLVVADFDWLPPPDLPSEMQPSSSNLATEGDPLVTDMQSVDYGSYLSAPTHCDILFPTDFSKLAKFLQKSWGKECTVSTQKQAAFLQQYGPTEVEATQSWLSGFSPLTDDFGNVQVLTITR